MIRISQWRENHFRTNTSIRREKKKTDCESQSQGEQKLSILVRSLKIIAQHVRSINSTRMGWLVLMMNVDVFKGK